MRVYLVCAVGLLAALGTAGKATAQDEAILTGRDALRGRRNYPWYDREQDATRAIRLGKEAVARPTRPPPTTTAPGQQLSIFARLLQVIGLLLLTALLVAIAAVVAWAFMRNEQTETHGQRVVETSRDVDRVEELPFQLKRPTGDFLAEARRLYEAGNYSEAIIYLYSYMLVQLDRQHVIRLAKGKTNRQYLREARTRAALAGIVLETTMVAFEDVFFGRHALDRERFEECFGQIDRFQGDLARLEHAAA